METNDTLQVDVDKVLADKNPGLARLLPRFVKAYLKKIVHQDEVNYVLRSFSHQPPVGFVRSTLDYMEITHRAVGLERLSLDGRYLFASNHPFGGMDGMMLADKLIDRFGDVRVVVNDLLMHVEPLRPLWIPVNKHGAQNAACARRFDEALFGELPILTFPAGLCSRRIDGRIADPEWKTSFLKKAYASQRQIVPVFVEGRLSDFFYNVDRFRKALGIRFNIEMLWLPDEMFSQKGKHFRIAVGDPIPVAELQHCGSLREQTEEVRKKTYFLENKLAGGAKTR